ncbi:MAG: metal-sensing transcriptional repressor [Candidatus Liptonbacteria bacterium]|nr:metal-sensing transcriptional repressor [Candidatus Liptonbacteria bacterium]
MEPAAKKKALRRLRIIKGQIAGLGRMVEADTYCIDLITQSSAIRQALSGIEDIILENHLSAHAVMQMKSGQAKKAAAEILKVYQLSKKK